MNELESQVMKFLLDGDNDELALLRKQFEIAIIKSKDYTGVGFYIEFSIPENASKLPNGRCFSIGDIGANIDGLKNGAGFILFIQNGLISTLEGYTYDELWPDSVEKFDIYYINKEKRILSCINNDISK